MPNLCEVTVESLSEAAVTDTGDVRLRIMAPGWSANGRYYPADVLERDGPSVFKAGTHMYVNHPTRTEEADRPERDLRHLAGVLTSDARWQESGPDGPGLYAEATLRSEFRPIIDELAEHIGVSIRGDGVVERGQAEGREGAIVSAITAAESVDYVTRPAAGGRVVQLIEAVTALETVESATRRLVEARNAGQWFESHIHLDFTRMADSLAMDGHLTRDERIALSHAIGEALQAFTDALTVEAPHLYDRDPYGEPQPTTTTVSESTHEPQEAPMPITEQEAQSLREAAENAARERDEARAELERERDARRISEARSAVSDAVADVEIPGAYESVAESIRARAAAQIQVVRDDQGAIVRDALAEAARRAVNAEVEQLTTLAEAAGVGRPSGAGAQPGGGTATTTLTEAQLDQTLATVFGRPTNQ